MAETVYGGTETLDDLNNGGQAQPETQNFSSSDSEMDDDAEDLRLETLEKELAENPSSYDSHVQYIKSLRKLGYIEELRQAREAMNSIFPLTPKMWQEWTKDEASLSTGDIYFAAIEKLYDRGVHEYLSVSLWCDYVNFVQGHDPVVQGFSPAGMLKMRDLYERALTAAGLHVVEGNKIWEAYRAFEQALFLSIDDSDSEEKEKQSQRIRNIFHRQLSVPLSNSRSTLLDYKAWEAEIGNTNEVNLSGLDGIPSHVASSYQKAMDKYNDRFPYEEQISRQDASDVERLQYFMTYLKFEQSSGDPARVQILYERAVTEFPVSTDIWLEYTRYLDQTLKVASIVKDVYSRAVKNCPWIGELWVRYLLSLERAHASEEELSAVFDQSLQCTFSSFEEYLDLFLTRVDGLRRIFLAGAEKIVTDYAVIRKTFQQAADFLSPHLKNDDSLLRLHAYWARLESKYGQDLVAARGVWESLLKTSGSMLGAWQGYIAMEIETGHIHEARSIYKRCYSKRFSGTGSEDICHAWLRFEREFGTLEDFDHAARKVRPRLEELQLFLSLESKNVAASSPKEILVKNSSQKRKPGMRSANEPPLKRLRDAAQHTKEVFVVDTIQELKEANNEESSEVKAEKLETTNKQIKDSTSEKNREYTDQCTLFISNLNVETKEEHLRDFFSDIGGVAAIRILRDKFTRKSRGLAYVDFFDDMHLAAAVAKNKQKLLGKKLSIARSDPKRSQKRNPVGSSTAMEHAERSGRGSSSNENVNSGSSRRHIQLKGKNTFAVPRTLVRPLGWSKDEPKNEESDEKPKSNDEFRKMLLNN